MALKFDKEGLANELLRNLEVELKTAFEAWKGEVYSKLKNGFFSTGADVDYEIEIIKDGIVAFLKANTYVLADSYGTGSLMLEDNPAYQAYKQTWHSERHTKAIHGRKEGEYTDLFGREKSSSGYMAGRNIEGWEMSTGFVIEPSSPSFALQDAEKALYNTYLDAAYRNAIRATNFAKFLIEDGR